MYTIHEKCLKISTALNIVRFIISFLNREKCLNVNISLYEHGLNRCQQKVNRPVSGLNCRFVCGHFREQFWTWNELRLCEKQQQNWQEYARELQWEKYFPRGVGFQMDRRSRQWPVWNDLKSQDAASQTKTTDVPRKKKRLWLNCYSLSDITMKVLQGGGLKGSLRNILCT